MKKISTKQKIALIISGLFLCVVSLEIGLRMAGLIISSLQEYRNWVSLRQKGTYRIMCLGESTTACSNYPHQLEEILNQPDIGIKFSVINKGIPAIGTTAIVSQLEDNLNKYTPDMVITMMGINDEGQTMAYEDIFIKKVTLFLTSFRTYKLAKFLRLQIINKAQAIGFCKSKDNISLQANDIIQPPIYNEQDKPAEEPEQTGQSNYQAYLELGQQYQRQGIFNKAVEIYKKAIQINPENDEAYSQLGLCYKHQGKEDKAEKMFNKAIEINPREDWVYFELGGCYIIQGIYAKAEEMLKKAVEINTSHHMAYLRLGWSYNKQGEYAKAEDMYKKAIQINSENDWAYGSLALCYKELGKYKLAEEYFKKADRVRTKYYNPITRSNYQRLREILAKKGIKLICVQYPMCSVEPLKKMLEPHDGVTLVDNERVFKEALKQASYDEYFSDSFAGNFGHCTTRGNRLLAENIANVILEEYFNK